MLESQRREQSAAVQHLFSLPAERLQELPPAERLELEKPSGKTSATTTTATPSAELEPKSDDCREPLSVHVQPINDCGSRASEELCSLLDSGRTAATALKGTDRTFLDVLLYNRRQRMSQKLEHLLEQKRRSLTVDLLAMLFGIGTWIGINGVFIQLPLLVEFAPEGWSLPSYLSVMVQLGNIGPLLYTLTQPWRRSCATAWLSDRLDAYLIYGLLILATLSALFTGFFYAETAVVFGVEHSVALLGLTGITAITACTSSVLFMPYMGRFQEKYLVTYFIGEGLSGLLPSVVALIQGIGITECRPIMGGNGTEGGLSYEPYTPPPLFGSEVFFFFICGAMLCSCIGFTLLDQLPLARGEYAPGRISAGNCYTYDTNNNPPVAGEEPTRATAVATAVAPADGTVSTLSGMVAEEKQSNDPESSSIASAIVSAGEQEAATDAIVAPANRTATRFWSLLLLMGVVSFFANGMFNSIQSYSCLPYGANAYHLAATLSVIANPLACFLAIFLPHTRLRSLAALLAVAAALTSYVFVTAGMSPLPPLVDSDAGAPLVITTWTLLIGVVSYVKLGITAVMRSLGGKSLMWTGAVTQLGSLIGSLLIFALINYTALFVAAYEENGGC